jgi:hypothetical protein
MTTMKDPERADQRENSTSDSESVIDLFYQAETINPINDGKALEVTDIFDKSDFGVEIFRGMDA